MEPHTLEPVGQRVRRLITEKGYTQQAFALRIGVGVSHLSRLLSGQRTWKVDLLERCASAFDLEFSTLVQGTDAESAVIGVTAVASTRDTIADTLATEQSAHQLTRAELVGAQAENVGLRAQIEQLYAQLKQVERDRAEATERVRRAEELAAQVRHELLTVRARAGAVEQNLTKQLNAATAIVVKNYEVAESWRKVAESRGAAAGVAGVAVIGFALLAAAKA